MAGDAQECWARFRRVFLEAFGSHQKYLRDYEAALAAIRDADLTLADAREASRRQTDRTVAELAALREEVAGLRRQMAASA